MHLLTSRLSPAQGALLAALLATLWLGVNHLLYRHGLHLPLTPPLLLLLGLAGLHSMLAWQTLYAERQRLLSQLSAYLPPEVARRVAREGDPFKPERRTLTIMFVDLRGFTALAENLAPEALAELLQHYLDLVTRIIHQHGGTLDKYMGDGLMAFWGAPQANPAHAQAAYNAALSIARHLAAPPPELANAGLSLRVGIGLHSGRAIVGNLGTPLRHSYTALGDTVNLAARIQQLTRNLNKTILLSAATAQALEHARLEDLGWHSVRGRQQPVHLFTPAPDAPSPAAQPPRRLYAACLTLALSLASPPTLAFDPESLYLRALSALEDGRPQEAIVLLQQLLALQPNYAGAYLDLALAYQALGDVQQAAAWLDTLLARFDPPPALRLWIEQQRQRLHQAQARAASTRWAIHQAFGYASNLNAAPRERSINIDLGYGPIELQLDERSRPQGAAYTESGLSVHTQRPYVPLTLEAAALLETRRYNTHAEYDSDGLHAWLHLHHPTPVGTWRYGGFIQYLRLDRNPYLQSAGLELALHKQIWPDLSLEAHLQRQHQHYPSAPFNDGQLWQSRIAAQIQLNPQLSSTLELQWESNQAYGERAGGDRHALGMGLSTLWQATPADQLELGLRLLEQDDHAPYNPLLFGDLQRRISRRDAMASYRHRLTPHWGVRFELRLRRDDANLGLFRQQDWQAHVRLTWTP